MLQVTCVPNPEPVRKSCKQLDCISISADIPVPVLPNAVVEELASSPSSQLSVTPPEDKGKSPTKGRNRCFTCKKKVGLTGEFKNCLLIQT